MMAVWNFDIDAAPRGQMVDQARNVKGATVRVTVYQPDRVILATKCGKVIGSNFIPGDGNKPDRWEFLATGEEPIAWQPWPSHPSEPTSLEPLGNEIIGRAA